VLGGGIVLLGLQGFTASEGARPDLLACVGSACAIFVLLTLVSALVASRELAWQRIAVRVAGSWIAAIGLLMSAWHLRATG
jgi:hypothetical protein